VRENIKSYTDLKRVPKWTTRPRRVGAAAGGLIYCKSQESQIKCSIFGGTKTSYTTMLAYFYVSGRILLQAS